MEALRTELQEVKALAAASQHKIEVLEAFASDHSRFLTDFSDFMNPATRDRVKDDRSSAVFIFSHDIHKTIQEQMDKIDVKVNLLTLSMKEQNVEANLKVKRLSDYADQSQARYTSFSDKLMNIDAFIDRLAGSLDELQRDLELKASYKELVQQGERFTYYTPLNITEKVQADLARKADTDALERLRDRVEAIGRSLGNYIPMTKEAELKEETSNIIASMLKDYSSKRDLKSLRRDVYNQFATLKAYTDDNFGYSQERDKIIKSDIDVLRDLVQRKPWTADLRPILQELELKAFVKDLDRLRTEAIPGIADCNARLSGFEKELGCFDTTLGRFDEIICDKASKSDIMDVKKTIKGFLSETKFIGKVLEIEETFRQAGLKTLSLEEELTKVYAAIEALQLQVSIQKKESRDYKLVYNTLMEVRDRVDSKADMSDLANLAERSALWSDTQMLKHQAELLKRQVESAAVLSASLARTLLKDIDTPAVKYRRRAEVYRLLISMLDWVRANKTSGVPEDLVEFEGTLEQSLSRTPKTAKSHTTELGLGLLKPRTASSTKRRSSLSFSKDKKELPPIVIHNS
jgi:hypothetical protein